MIAVVAAGVGWFVIRPRANQSATSQTGYSSQPPANCRNNPQPVFTATFTDLAKIKSIAPIGGVMVGSPARSYITVKGGGTTEKEMAPLYAPIDAVLEGIVFARRDPTNPQAPGEYRLDFRSSCEVTFHYDHIDEVPDEIRSLGPSTPADNTREATRTNLAVKAGQLVGRSDGTAQSGGFDFYLLNSGKTVPHINPVRWTWEQSTIADCPYDYFTPELKEQYYGAFRSQDNAKLLKLDCGSPSHDLIGTASGGWFKDQSTTNEGLWLEIANMNGRAELLIREDGNHLFAVRDYQAKIMPDAVKVGQSVCYSEGQKWVYIKVASEMELWLAKDEGSCPSSIPTTNIETWQR